MASMHSLVLLLLGVAMLTTPVLAICKLTTFELPLLNSCFDPPTQNPPIQEPGSQNPPIQEPPGGNSPIDDPPTQNPPIQEPPGGNSPIIDDLPTMKHHMMIDPPTQNPPIQEPPGGNSPIKTSYTTEAPQHEKPQHEKKPTHELSAESLSVMIDPPHQKPPYRKPLRTRMPPLVYQPLHEKPATLPPKPDDPMYPPKVNDHYN